MIDCTVHLVTSAEVMFLLVCLSVCCITQYVNEQICIAHTVYCTLLMRSELNRQAGQPTALSLHTQAERSGPTTGHSSQQQSGLHLP